MCRLLLKQFGFLQVRFFYKFQLWRGQIKIIYACLIASISVFSASAVTIDTSDTNERFMIAMTDKLTLIDADSQGLAISGVKELYSFAGELYYVIECTPIGYFIFHPASGVVVESSPSSFSPYIKYSEGDMYYGGPTEYYIKSGTKYIHTVIDEEITLEIDVERMKLTSLKIVELLEQDKDVALLDYLATGNQVAFATSRRANTETKGG